MEVTLKRLSAPFHFEALDAEGHDLLIDAAPSLGGTGQGWRPMELLLAGLGGCALIDVVHILQKGGRSLMGVEAKIRGEREPQVIPSPFTQIHLHFVLTGPLDEAKVKRAIDLSLEKYCSAAKMLEKTAQITSSFEVVTI